MGPEKGESNTPLVSRGAVSKFVEACLKGIIFTFRVSGCASDLTCVVTEL